MIIHRLVISILLSFGSAHAQVAIIGQPMPSWEPGYLDLHHINTGVGDAAFYVFPDGTTLLFDAGENMQQQLMFPNMRPSQIEQIFVTHMYGNHVFGLPEFMLSLEKNTKESAVKK